jgi:hypothetical protein
MPGEIVITQGFSGRATCLHLDQITEMTEHVCGADGWGIARRPGDPQHDFPVTWIEYTTPAHPRSAKKVEYFVALQSASEMHDALRKGTADLHALPTARDRFRDFLKDAARQGIEQFSVYAPFGTSKARETWGQGFLKIVPVANLISNIEARRALGYTGISKVEFPLPAARPRTRRPG